MSEIDLITAISNHFPVHITRSILSTNVANIKDALTFLRRLDALEPKVNTQSRHEPGTSQVGGSSSANRPNYRENRSYNRPQQADKNERQLSFNRNQNWYSGYNNRRRQPFGTQTADSRQRDDGYRNRGHNERQLNARAEEYHPQPQNSNLSGGSQPGNYIISMTQTDH
jgi:hypothetical protein